MQLTKFGHSCVLIDDGQSKILFDPGMWTDQLPTDIKVDAVVVTHVHQDHLGLERYGEVFKSAPRIITNPEVKVELDKHQINCEVAQEGIQIQVNTMILDPFGAQHAILHPELLPVFHNIGYLVNEKIFHPGDRLTLPSKPVETLLLPLSAPWSKVSETMDYMIKLKPKTAMAIHDAFLNDKGISLYGHFMEIARHKAGTEFIQPELGKIYEV